MVRSPHQKRLQQECGALLPRPGFLTSHKSSCRSPPGIVIWMGTSIAALRADRRPETRDCGAAKLSKNTARPLDANEITLRLHSSSQNISPAWQTSTYADTGKGTARYESRTCSLSDSMRSVNAPGCHPLIPRQVVQDIVHCLICSPTRGTIKRHPRWARAAE